MSDQPKSFHLSREIHEYLTRHSEPADEIQRELMAATAALGGISLMQIAPEQAAFMTLLTRLVGARRAIEIGTFTGLSALAVARGLPVDGRLICCDVSDEWTRVGQPYWERAGVADRIDLRIAPALETLDDLAGGPPFDLAFIDADKINYRNYYEKLLPMMRPGGLILVDNVLWMGSVVDPQNQREDTRAIRDFNAHVAADPRVETVMLAVSDGLTFLRVRD